ncbi:hypothetical protein CAV8706_0162 [Campylobacter avium]|nr:hypothetical protein CAV8706_0162 [Campylobacter avium]
MSKEPGLYGLSTESEGLLGLYALASNKTEPSVKATKDDKITFFSIIASYKMNLAYYMISLELNRQKSKKLYIKI